MDALPEVAAPIPSPAYVELQRDVVVNADIWETTARILAADLGFEGIIGIPDLNGPADLNRAIAAGAGVNADYARLTPTPVLRNLTSGIPITTLIAGGYGATVVRGDALPIVFSWPVLPGTLSPTDIAIRLNTGELVTPAAAALNPNFDYNERNVVVVFGEFGNRLAPGTEGAIYPVSVEVVADATPLQLIGPDGPQSAVGLTAASRSPYAVGPSLLGAKLSRFSSVGDGGPVTLTGGILNDGATLYQDKAVYRLRLLTSGGFSPDGVSPMMPGDYAKFFQLQARDANGQLVTIARDGVAYDLGPGLGSLTVVGLAELGGPATGVPAPYYRSDNDNLIDIILSGDEAAIRALINVVIPTSSVTGYSDIYTPGGPGRTPTPGVTYTRPAGAQTLAIVDALDTNPTVSYAAQQVSAYDVADNLPVVFRLHHAGTADTVYTASSRRANALLAEGYAEQGVPFANEAASPLRVAVREFHSATATDHIYTADAAEIARLRQTGSGYADQGAAFTALAGPMPGAVPIHRFHAAALGDHLYTPALTEGFTADGYAYEGIGWYSADLLPGSSSDVLFDRDDRLDFAGVLTGNDTLLKRGTGTLALSADSRLTGTTRVEAGTLEVNGALKTSGLSVAAGATLTGTGVIEGSVVNAGILSPGRSPGLMSIAGNLTNSAGASLRLELDGTAAGTGNGFHDRLDVTGNFMAAGLIAPTTRGFAEAASPFTPVPGDGFTVVTAGGGISGSFAGLTQPASGLPAGTRFDLTYGSHDLMLHVTPARYDALPGLTDRQRAVAGALDAARPVAGTRDFTDRDKLYAALYGTDAAALPTALDSLSGRLHADAAAISLDTMRLFGDMLIDRTAAIRRSALSTRMRPMAALAAEADGEARALSRPTAPEPTPNLWGRAIVGKGKRGGVDMNVAGFATGIDASPVPGLELGLAAGYFRADLDDALDQGDMGVYALAGYGSFTTGHVFVDGSLSYGFTDYDSRRQVRLGALTRTARADGNGEGVGAALTAGYRWASGNLMIEPSAGLRLDRTRRQAFSEVGADALDLAVTRVEMDTLRSSVGTRAAWRYRMDELELEPEIQVRWDHDLLDRAAGGRASLDDASFTLSGEKTGRDAAILGGAVTARLDERLEAYVQVDLELRDGGDRQVASAGVRLRFG